MNKEQEENYNRIIAAICWMIKSNSDRARLIDYVNEFRDSFKTKELNCKDVKSHKNE